MKKTHIYYDKEADSLSFSNILLLQERKHQVRVFKKNTILFWGQFMQHV